MSRGRAPPSVRKKNKETKKENKNCWGHNKNVMSLCRPLVVCVAKPRGSGQDFGPGPKGANCGRPDILCVCVLFLWLYCLSFLPANQPNILFLPSSLPFLPPPLCRSFVLLFFARHYFYFNVVCFSQFSSVQLGLVRCSLARKSSRPLGLKGCVCSDIEWHCSATVHFRCLSISTHLSPFPLWVLPFCLVLCLLQLYLN